MTCSGGAPSSVKGRAMRARRVSSVAVGATGAASRFSRCASAYRSADSSGPRKAEVELEGATTLL